VIQIASTQADQRSSLEKIAGLKCHSRRWAWTHCGEGVNGPA
jgi:hypothetical protein